MRGEVVKGAAVAGTDRPRSVTVGERVPRRDGPLTDGRRIESFLGLLSPCEMAFAAGKATSARRRRGVVAGVISSL